MTLAISVGTVLGASVAVYCYMSLASGNSLEQHLSFLVPLALSVAGVVAIPATDTLAKYYAVQAGSLVCFLVAGLVAARWACVSTVLLVVFLSQLILYEPYPTNLAVGLFVTLVLIGGTSARLLAIGEPPGLVIRHQLITGVTGVAVVLFGGLMSKYRDLIVHVTRDRDRLRDSILELTRTNSAYQDYAVVVQEHATEQERQRITRDIHDIVGYTLTNNLMLMESALDLMKESPLALPSIIETARENSQEGLDRVRAAMYRLRQQHNPYPIGLNAIARLGRTFEQATGTTVAFDFGNMPITTTPQIDSAMYHLVQSALVNSFRHGSATEVSVSFWCDQRSIQVLVQDNGSGTPEVVEGIGLKGMRERIQEIGGTLEVRDVGVGFAVLAVIDYKGTSDE